MAEKDQQDTSKNFMAIQKIAILLTGAVEFVCKKEILKRFSNEIETNLKKLENSFESIRKTFSGKIPDHLNADNALTKIKEISFLLKKGGSEAENRCESGKLGNDLATANSELKSIIQEIRDLAGGKISHYSFFDKALNYTGKGLSFLLHLSPLVTKTGKIIFATILVATCAFIYLFFTIETEDIFLESMKNDFVYLEMQSGRLKKKTLEYQEIVEKMKALNNDEKLDREGKIEWLNLSMKKKKLKDLIEKIMIFIEARERKIEEKNRKAEEIREKPFLKKLFHQ